MTGSWRNWAGNQQARPVSCVKPTSVAQVQTSLRRAAAQGMRVKAVGTGHSFSGIAQPEGLLVDVSAHTGIESAASDGRVWVRAGTPLHQLNRELGSRGLAMSNLGDIDRQTIAGAISTGTHGTGLRLGGLATQVCGLELVLADGTVLRCNVDTDAELFSAARIGLGALGIITAVQLQCESAFALHAQERPMPLDVVLDSIDELAEANDHFEFFWFPGTDVALTKQNNRTSGPTKPQRPLKRWLDDELFANTAFGLTARVARRWPMLTPRLNRLSCRLLSTREYTDSSDRVFCSPRNVRFLEMEYAVPRQSVGAALAGIRAVLESGEHLVSFPIEVRFAAADEIPLSTAYGRETAYLAVHMFEGQPHEQYFAAVESVLQSLDGRPHWGKLHTRTASDLKPVYPKFDDFLDVRGRVDPEGRFANQYLDQVLGLPVGVTA